MKPLRETASLFNIMRSQEWGARKECIVMLRAGAVEWAHEPEDEDIEPEDFAWTTERDGDTVLATQGLWLRCNGMALPVLPALYLALHKPGGVECSRKPESHESVFDFFPVPFISRGLQPVGRLDADTTGLLLLTDDGLFNHAVTSPRRKQPKVYRVTMKHPLTDEQVSALERGVVLRDDPRPTEPAVVRRISGHEADIVISEGRYHQIKRMGAAVGNRVEAIHRTAVGPLELGDLPEGEWRFLTRDEVSAFTGTSPA